MESFWAGRQEGLAGKVNAAAASGYPPLAGDQWVARGAAAKPRGYSLGLLLGVALCLGVVLPLAAKEAKTSDVLEELPPQETSVAESRDLAKPEQVDAFPADSTKTKVPKAKGKTAPKRDRVTRRVKEPVTSKTGRAPVAEPARGPVLPELLGPPRAPKSVAERRSGSTSTPGVAIVGSQSNEPTSLSVEDFAPYGRLVKCELVFTVDSISLNTPIVGLVMEDVWWNGRLIIPAGTEVFSKALPDRVANRIGDDGKWTFVLPEQDQRINGRELIVHGFALDRDETNLLDNGRVRSWSLSDGAAGLQGYVIDEANPEKIRLFVATALGGAVDGLASGLQTRVPAGGNDGRRGLSVVPATVGNAAIAAAGTGSTEALKLLARQIFEEIQRNGAYVRVPAGKPFYVFIDQTINPREARVGARASPN